MSERADRILDAAGVLLTRFGYRKVTIEDIARQAGIGKGTIYLHWRTKDALFEAMMLRESVILCEEIVAALREDPAEIRPHRFLRLAFMATSRRPVLLSMFTGDAEQLGKLREYSVRGKDLLASELFFGLMIEHGLLRDDVPDIRYAMQATSLGFYLLETVSAEDADLALELKGDAFARTVKAAFEPAGETPAAAVAAVAPVLIAVFEDLVSSYRKVIYPDDEGPG
ncbi:TetR/AcrR family transcriptional regulator [Amycolatopsis sp. H20-H5]|uniref:TetR/AcrR family transcriptional regulator n=1 Tax=Amycolatopsis sp. H20-H5 TaxID=3046309 RepID=UPI002DBD8477|nr:TetR family transcriptional regulator [Amycolatopsis sp. H20-H5]MEC3976285.1 TetR family transcriptional regulator [Amycolatopsis sp. H20-H5]